MPFRSVSILLTVSTVLVIVLPGGSARAEHDTFLTKRGDVEMVSLNPKGQPADGDSCSSQPPSISDDGRFVVFASSSQNAHPSDVNGPLSDVFLRDRKTGRTTLVSATTHGVSPPLPSDLSHLADVGCMLWSDSPSLSGSGRYVVYNSKAPITDHEEDRVAGVLPTTKVFVYDRKTRANELVSVAKDGGIPNDASGFGGADISSNGRYVVFESAATNLVDLPGCNVPRIPAVGDPPIRLSNCNIQTYLYDRTLKKTVLVTKTPEGGLPNNDLSPLGQSQSTPRISDDGRFVLFGSRANNLVGNDLNICVGQLPSCDDVYRYDVKRDKIELISVARTGLAGNKASHFSNVLEAGQTMSSNGRYVAFTSDADDLIPAGGTSGVYVRDTVRARTEQLSVSSVGRDIHGTGVSISDDGRFASFYGIDCGHAVVPICGSSLTAMMYHDRRTGRTDVVHVLDREGERVEEGVSPSGWAISGSGGHVVWSDDGPEPSTAVQSPLVNQYYAHFVRDFRAQALGVSAWNHRAGRNEATRVTDVANDSSIPRLGEIQEARVVPRPDLEDIYFRVDVADTGVAGSGLLLGPPGISYRFRLTYSGRRYEVTSSQAIAGSRSVVSSCTADWTCNELADVEGWWGTAGESIVLTVPAQLFGGAHGQLEGVSVSAVLDLPSGPQTLDQVRWAR